MLHKKVVNWDGDLNEALRNQIYNENVDIQFFQPSFTSKRDNVNKLLVQNQPQNSSEEKGYFYYEHDNLQQYIDKYNKVEKDMLDVLSRDQDVFENSYDTQIYAVVVLLATEFEGKIYKLYQGHVYTWVFDKSPENCWMIGIRNRVDTIFRRLDAQIHWTSLQGISKYLLEGVRTFAMYKNCQRIVVAQPLATMKQILVRYGFKFYDVNPNDIGSSPFKISKLFGWFLSYDNLQTPFITDTTLPIKIDIY